MFYVEAVFSLHVSQGEEDKKETKKSQKQKKTALKENIDIKLQLTYRNKDVIFG